jgi:tetratricopeptide (TPR) repeat protein
MAFLKIAVCLLPALAVAQKLEVTSPLGTKLYSLPDSAGAVAKAQKALAADPNNVDLVMKLSQAQAGIRENREAAETCTAALKKAPQNSDLLTERGHRYVALREFAKAKADLSKSASIDPKKVDTYYHLGLAHYFLGEFAQAGDAFQHAVDLAPTTDSRINSTNWLYASLRRAGKKDEAARAIAAITPEMKNTEPHTFFYLSLVRFFQGKMPETEAVPPAPTAGSDQETELRFDTVAYGVGNWYLYNGNRAKAAEYFKKVVAGQVWNTWGFVGSETELARK